MSLRLHILFVCLVTASFCSAALIKHDKDGETTNVDETQAECAIELFKRGESRPIRGEVQKTAFTRVFTLARARALYGNELGKILFATAQRMDLIIDPVARFKAYAQLVAVSADAFEKALTEIDKVFAKEPEVNRAFEEITGSKLELESDFFWQKYIETQSASHFDFSGGFDRLIESARNLARSGVAVSHLFQTYLEFNPVRPPHFNETIPDITKVILHMTKWSARISGEPTEMVNLEWGDRQVPGIRLGMDPSTPLGAVVKKYHDRKLAPDAKPFGLFYNPLLLISLRTPTLLSVEDGICLPTDFFLHLDDPEAMARLLEYDVAHFYPEKEFYSDDPPTLVGTTQDLSAGGGKEYRSAKYLNEVHAYYSTINAQISRMLDEPNKDIQQIELDTLRANTRSIREDLENLRKITKGFYYVLKKGTRIGFEDTRDNPMRVMLTSEDPLPGGATWAVEYILKDLPDGKPAVHAHLHMGASILNIPIMGPAREKAVEAFYVILENRVALIVPGGEKLAQPNQDNFERATTALLMLTALPVNWTAAISDFEMEAIRTLEDRPLDEAHLPGWTAIANSMPAAQHPDPRWKEAMASLKEHAPFTPTQFRLHIGEGNQMMALPTTPDVSTLNRLAGIDARFREDRPVEFTDEDAVAAIVDVLGDSPFVDEAIKKQIAVSGSDGPAKDLVRNAIEKEGQHVKQLEKKFLAQIEARIPNLSLTTPVARFLLGLNFEDTPAIDQVIALEKDTVQTLLIQAVDLRRARDSYVVRLQQILSKLSNLNILTNYSMENPVVDVILRRFLAEQGLPTKFISNGESKAEILLDTKATVGGRASELLAPSPSTSPALKKLLAVKEYQEKHLPHSEPLRFFVVPQSRRSIVGTYYTWVYHSDNNQFILPFGEERALADSGNHSLRDDLELNQLFLDEIPTPFKASFIASYGSKKMMRPLTLFSGRAEYFNRLLEGIGPWGQAKNYSLIGHIDDFESDVQDAGSEILHTTHLAQSMLSAAEQCLAEPEKCSLAYGRATRETAEEKGAEGFMIEFGEKHDQNFLGFRTQERNTAKHLHVALGDKLQTGKNDLILSLVPSAKFPAEAMEALFVEAKEGTKLSRKTVEALIQAIKAYQEQLASVAKVVQSYANTLREVYQLINGVPEGEVLKTLRESTLRFKNFNLEGKETAQDFSADQQENYLDAQERSVRIVKALSERRNVVEAEKEATGKKRITPEQLQGRLVAFFEDAEAIGIENKYFAQLEAELLDGDPKKDKAAAHLRTLTATWDILINRDTSAEIRNRILVYLDTLSESDRKFLTNGSEFLDDSDANVLASLLRTTFTKALPSTIELAQRIVKHQKERFTLGTGKDWEVSRQMLALQAAAHAILLADNERHVESEAFHKFLKDMSLDSSLDDTSSLFAFSRLCFMDLSERVIPIFLTGDESIYLGALNILDPVFIRHWTIDHFIYALEQSGNYTTRQRLADFLVQIPSLDLDNGHGTSFLEDLKTNKYPHLRPLIIPRWITRSAAVFVEVLRIIEGAPDEQKLLAAMEKEQIDQIYEWKSNQRKLSPEQATELDRIMRNHPDRSIRDLAVLAAARVVPLLTNSLDLIVDLHNSNTLSPVKQAQLRGILTRASSQALADLLAAGTVQHKHAAAYCWKIKAPRDKAKARIELDYAWKPEIERMMTPGQISQDIQEAVADLSPHIQYTGNPEDANRTTVAPPPTPLTLQPPVEAVEEESSESSNIADETIVETLEARGPPGAPSVEETPIEEASIQEVPTEEVSPTTIQLQAPPKPKLGNGNGNGNHAIDPSRIRTNNFNVEGNVDERQRRVAPTVQRAGQARFRKTILGAYGSRCAVTGLPLVDLLEAPHIIPYMGDQTDDVTNGICMRQEMHNLFDRCLLRIDAETYEVQVSPYVTEQTDEFDRYQNRTLNLPEDHRLWPNHEALFLREVAYDVVTHFYLTGALPEEGTELAHNLTKALELNASAFMKILSKQKQVADLLAATSKVSLPSSPKAQTPAIEAQGQVQAPVGRQALAGPDADEWKDWLRGVLKDRLNLSVEPNEDPLSVVRNLSEENKKSSAIRPQRLSALKGQDRSDFDHFGAELQKLDVVIYLDLGAPINGALASQQCARDLDLKMPTQTGHHAWFPGQFVEARVGIAKNPEALKGTHNILKESAVAQSWIEPRLFSPEDGMAVLKRHLDITLDQLRAHSSDELPPAEWQEVLRQKVWTLSDFRVVLIRRTLEYLLEVAERDSGRFDAEFKRVREVWVKFPETLLEADFIMGKIPPVVGQVPIVLRAPDLN